MMEHKPHVSEEKKKQVEELQQLFDSYPVIGVVNLANLPTKMLQKIKRNLRKDVIFKITKKSLINVALDTAKKKNLNQLKEKLEGYICLLFTHLDPFTLAKNIEKSKKFAPLKTGQISPTDLEIEEGPTPFTPGPMIGELGVLGLKTEVKEGKIHIKVGKVVVKEGEAVSQKVADILSKLGIEPMKLGLDLAWVYENGQILQGKFLVIDEEEYTRKVATAHAHAFALAMHACYMTKDTVPQLIAKAWRGAKELLKKSGLITPENAAEKIAEAARAAESVHQQAPDAPSEIVHSAPSQPEQPFQSIPSPHQEDITIKVVQAFQEPTPLTQTSENISEAEKLLKHLNEKAFSVEGAPKKQKGQTQPFDVNKFINKLKDEQHKS